MNQSQLAKQAGYSRSMLCLVLRGMKRPGLQGALRLERITGIPVKLWAHGTPRQLQQAFARWARWAS